MFESLIILFNVLFLIFVYFKFINGIKNKADKSVEKFKKEISRTVNAFNEEFDRNFTLLDDRALKLDKLINNADKYVNLLVHLDKKMDTTKVVNLAKEIKQELEMLYADQKVLKQSINKYRAHNAKPVSFINKEVKSENEKAKKPLIDDDIKNNIRDEYKNIEKSSFENKNIEKSVINKYEKLSFEEDGVSVEISGRERPVDKNNNFNNNELKSDNENNKLESKPSDFAHKAYKSSIQNEEDGYIDEFLKQNMQKDIVDIENLHQKELLNDKKGFQQRLSENLSKDYVYNQSEDNNPDESVEPESTSDLQNEIFILLSKGHSITEICSSLGISRGEAEMHKHIYNARRKAK